MPSVRVRVTAGVGAWIVGATTATGLSLFAVSYLSEDPQSPQGATLSQNQVEQALASVTQTETPIASTTSPNPAATGPSTNVLTPALTPAQSSPSSPSATNPHNAPTRSTPAAQPVDRSLSADAGTVVAQCQDDLVYLETWSPAQGYQAQVEQRGPARLATVLFTGNGGHAAFRVSCQGGVPTLVVDDDTGIDH